MWQKYQHASPEAREAFKEELGQKCISTKQAASVIDAIVNAMASMVAAETVRVLKLQQLVDFEILLRHDFSS